MDRRSLFAYGASTFEALLSSLPWLPGDETVGGSRDAASGAPASYIVRRDALSALQLRIWESEWEDYLALIAYGQSKAPFLWYPDADEAENFLVYLQSPEPGSRWAPARDNNFPRVFIVSLTLRGVATVTPWTPYFT